MRNDLIWDPLENIWYLLLVSNYVQTQFLILVFFQRKDDQNTLKQIRITSYSITKSKNFSLDLFLMTIKIWCRSFAESTLQPYGLSGQGWIKVGVNLPLTFGVRWSKEDKERSHRTDVALSLNEVYALSM